MKRLLSVLVLSVPLSATAQVGSQVSDATVVVRGLDGAPHQLEVPNHLPVFQGHLQVREGGDLESVAGSQEGCPVQIVDAVFERPGRLMLTGQTSPSAQLETDGGPTLHLNYRNFSGKDIDSVVLTGWIKVKDDPYQLDYVVRPFQLVLSRKSLLGKDVQAQQALVLGGNAYGLDRIVLSRVIYADGSIWMPELNRCVYRSLGSTEQAKAW